MRSDNARLIFVSPVLMWLIVLIGGALLWWRLPERMLYPTTIAGLVLLAVTVANWLYFLIGAIRVNKTAPSSAAAVSRLVTWGVYSKIRHPIYAADIVLGWGIFLAWPHLRILAIVAWATVVLICWMKLEEAALIAKFGDEYRDYRRRVPMIIPAYFRKPSS